MTTYQLLSQLGVTCPHSSPLCWAYSLQLQALPAPGLLATKQGCFGECVYIGSPEYPYLHPLRC